MHRIPVEKTKKPYPAVNIKMLIIKKLSRLQVGGAEFFYE